MLDVLVKGVGDAIDKYPDDIMPGVDEDEDDPLSALSGCIEEI